MYRPNQKFARCFSRTIQQPGSGISFIFAKVESVFGRHFNKRYEWELLWFICHEYGKTHNGMYLKNIIRYLYIISRMHNWLTLPKMIHLWMLNVISNMASRHIFCTRLMCLASNIPTYSCIIKYMRTSGCVCVYLMEFSKHWHSVLEAKVNI